MSKDIHQHNESVLGYASSIHEVASMLPTKDGKLGRDIVDTGGPSDA